MSAGGSGVFDLVVPRLRVALSLPVAGLLRSGCYVTHDQGHYQRLVHAVNQRLGCDDAQGLRAALEVWALVQSLPEPGLAILAVGKRDVSFDLGMPLPLATCARASRERVPAPEGWAVHKLNDQHAYLRPGVGHPGPAGRRPRLPGHLAPVHDLRQVALDADRRRGLHRGRRDRHLLLSEAVGRPCAAGDRGPGPAQSRPHPSKEREPC